MTSPVTPDEPESARTSSTDIEDRRLRRLAHEAMSDANGWYNGPFFRAFIDDDDAPVFSEADSYFFAAATPSVVLRLLDRGALSTASESADGWERLRRIQSELNALRSDGPFMDTLTAEGPWWTAADPAFVALYEAIIAASDALQPRSTEQGGAG